MIREATVESAPRGEPEAAAAYLTATEPGRLGVVHLVGIAAAFLLTGAFTLAMRLEMLGPGQTIMAGAAFRQLALLRDVLLVLLCALPSVSAFGLLALGAWQPEARSKLSRAALALHAVGAAAVLAAVGTVGAGWPCVLLLAVGAAVIAFAALLQAVAFLAALGRAEAPSLLLGALRVTAALQVVVMPLVAGRLTGLVIEHVAGATLVADAGRDPLVFEAALRRLLQPLALPALLPALGVVSDLIASHAGRALHGRRAVSLSLWVLAVFGFVSYEARVLVPAPGSGAQAVASFFALAMAAPLAVLATNWVATLATGEVRRSVPLGLAAAPVMLVLMAGATGLPLAMLDVGATLRGTTFASAHEGYVLSALAFAGLAALHAQWQRLTGRRYTPRPAILAAVLMFAGVNVTLLADALAGVRGLPRAFWAYPAVLQPVEITAALGACLAAAGVVLAALNLLASLRRPR